MAGRDVLGSASDRRKTLLNPCAIAPTADLVAWSRLGSSYDPQELRDAVDEL